MHVIRDYVDTCHDTLFFHNRQHRGVYIVGNLQYLVF